LFSAAKIGGWLGLAIGASVFSFVEIFLFILVQGSVFKKLRFGRKVFGEIYIRRILKTS
jgi:hypothetical protein